MKLVACRLVAVVVAKVVVPKELIPETHRPPLNIELPETRSWVIEVVAKVEVPLAVKSNTPLISPPITTPPVQVVVVNLPVVTMLSAVVSPKTMGPFKVVVPETIKSPVEVKSAKEPVAAVKEATVPLMIMLSVEALPKTTSPLRVVVAVTVKSSEASKLLLTVR